MLSATSNVAATNAGRDKHKSKISGVGSSNVLMYAAQQGNVDKVRQLIRDQRPLLFQRDRSKKTPLHYCCTSDQKRAAQVADYLVMAAPELLDNKDEDGFTALHLAVIAGNMPLVTFLLANNADVNAVDNEDHTVVHWAAVCGETEALRAVLTAGAQVSTPDVHKGYPLHYAAQMCGGNEKDASLGFQILQTLLSHSNIDVKVEDGDGRQPLLWAASAGSTKAVLALVRAGSPVEAADKDGLTALHCAASRGHTDCIDTLLTLCGASCDVIDSNGCTALHYAVTLGHADATALLLAHGSDPNRQDRKGRTPAHCGCSKGQLETVKMIGAHGANLWLKNARGDLPLHEAASSGRIDLVKWLLSLRPSQVNARNNDGRCPLHLAALNDNVDMCKILLDAGAQVNPILRTSKNVFMTPLDCALRRGFRSTAKYLQLHGGVPASKLSNDLQQPTNSALSLQIRDDIAFWNDSSSDSERENGEYNKHVKGQRKKLSKKYERKRASASGSDLGDTTSGLSTMYRVNRKITEKFKLPKVNTDSATSPSDHIHISKKPSQNRFDYTNEIVVNGNTEINIHQTREFSFGHEQTDMSLEEKISEKILTSPPVTLKSANEKSKLLRPKSAKHGLKSASNKSDSETSNVLMSSASSYNKKVKLPKRNKTPKTKLKDQATNTPDVSERSENSPTQKSNEIFVNQEMSTDVLANREKEFVQTDRISDTSGEQEVQEEIIVKASVHEPPKEHKDCQQPAQAVNDAISENNQPLSEISSVHQEILKKEIEELKHDEPERNLQDLEDIDENEAMKNIVEAEPTSSVSSEKAETGLAENDVFKNSTELNSTQDTELKTSEIDNEKLTVSQEHDTSTDKEAANENSQNNGTAAENSHSHTTASININIEQEVSVKLHEKQETNNDEASNQPEKNEDVGDPPTFNSSHAKTSDHILAEETKEDKTIEKVDEGDLNVVNELTEKALQQAFGESINTTTEDYEKEKTRFIKKIPTVLNDTMKTISADNKTHKSFTVLGENETDNEKITQTKIGTRKLPLMKQRSKSEENRREKTKHSKIPTLLGKTRLSKSDKHLNRINQPENLILDPIDTNNVKQDIKKQYRSKSNISTRRAVLIDSDIEKGTGSEDDEREERAVIRRKRPKHRFQRRDSRSAGSDYESSNVIDSGFEPSPRSVRVPRWKNVSERGVNMTTVTQSIQSNIRRYHLERKIFQHLLDLKRLQIRSGQHNEAMLVKRAVDAYHNSCASTVGAGRYVPKEMTFKSFEKFLYDSLRKLQKTDAEHLSGLPEAPRNPLLCTRSTHRCMHAMHAYTGVPCAAYLPKLDHHTIPKIGFGNCKSSTGGFLPNINPKNAVTLELCHGNDKQVITLPADKLDHNKRYYVTFTVKGNEVQSATNDTVESTAHRHSRSD